MQDNARDPLKVESISTLRTGLSNDQVVYLRPDWNKFLRILGESASAERASYRGNVLSANVNRVHHPENTKTFGANGTTGDKLITHRGALLLGLPLTLEAKRQQPQKRSLSDARIFPPCLRKPQEVGGNGQPWPSDA